MRPITLHGHEKSVSAIKFSHEGDLLFTAARDAVPSVWNAKTGERLGTYDVGGHRGAVWCLDTNYACSLLATGGGDMKTCLWRVDNGRCLSTIEHDSASKAVGFSHSDEHLFVVTDDKMQATPALNLYNLPDMDASAIPKLNPCAKYESPGNVIKHAEWGPTNSTIVLCCGDGSVKLIDTETFKPVREWKVHSQEIRRVHYDPQYYTIVTASKDMTAKLLDSRDLREIVTYKTDVPVNDASISPTADHVLLGGGTEAQDVTTTGGESKFEVKFFHKVYGTMLGSMPAHFGTINTVAFSPSGEGFSSGGEDGLVKIYTFDEAYKTFPGATATSFL
jgi:translation initiation factor 3 subunit I